MNRQSGAIAAALIATTFLVPTAHAESGRYNLRFSAGPAGPPVGVLGEASFDFQLAPPFALDFTAGGGYVSDGNVDAAVVTIGAGARFRFLDDYSGYLDEGGSAAGNLWIAPHVGFAFAPGGPAFMADVSVGYDFSIASPVSIGLFARGILAVSEFGPMGAVTGGISVSIEFEPIRPEEIEPPPLVDTDRDGVFDPSDACPGTPQGASVDERGCVPAVRVLVLENIEFAYDSAEIQLGSEASLSRAAAMLHDNPEVRVEIGGHTDDVGGAEYNETLSLARAQSVREWLVRRGLDRSRLEVRGYGSSQPIVPNVDDASRARNRRIEFRQVD